MPLEQLLFVAGLLLLWLVSIAVVHYAWRLALRAGVSNKVLTRVAVVAIATALLFGGLQLYWFSSLN